MENIHCNHLFQKFDILRLEHISSVLNLLQIKINDISQILAQILSLRKWFLCQ